MGRNSRRDKTEILRDRLQLEDTRLLFQIEEAAELIEGMSAGQRLDALTQAEERLSEAIRCLEQAIEPEREAREAN